MRTPKRLDAQQRVIDQPALLPCPHCGDLLVMCNSLAWHTTVQTLDRVLSVASRSGRCPHETCAGSRLRLLSAEAQRLALPHTTYGYDVRAGSAPDEPRDRKPVPRYQPSPAEDDGPQGPNATHAATPRRLGTPTETADRGPVTQRLA